MIIAFLLLDQIFLLLKYTPTLYILSVHFWMDLQPTVYINVQKVSISWRDREPMCGSAFSASHFLHLTYMPIPFHILNYADSLSSIELLNCFSAHCFGCINSHKFHCLHQAHSEMQWTVFFPNETKLHYTHAPLPARH